MKEYEEIVTTDDVWGYLMDGHDVMAVDLKRREFHELADCSVGEVVRIMKDENVIYFKFKPREGGNAE